MIEKSRSIRRVLSYTNGYICIKFKFMEDRVIIKGRYWFYKLECDKTLIKEDEPTDKIRYILGEENIKECEDKILICIGINPSTAVPDKLDPTLTRVDKYAHKEKYKAWYMLNIYPWRETVPKKLEKDTDNDTRRNIIHNKNKYHIRKLLESILKEYKNIHVWRAWGNTVDSREYLKKFKNEIMDIFEEMGINNYIDCTETKKGNPCHPLARLKKKETNNKYKL